MDRTTKSDTFSLYDYDGIGFDLDCTLAEYKLKELMKLVYNGLVDYLMRKKNYGSEYFTGTFEEGESFLQKGLFMDFKRGNIIKLNGRGGIQRATHGTAPLTAKEIKKQYDSKTTSSILQEFVTNPLATLHSNGKKLRVTLDCFDMPCVLLFARMVDHMDRQKGQPLHEYNFWNDILDGLYFLYGSDNFATGESQFYSELTKNPSLYYHKWSPEKLAWLKELKAKKFTFLVTGACAEFAAHTASFCIGENWKEYFNIIVTFAKKPYFFSHTNPFVRYEQGRPEIIENEIKVNDTYCYGNWKKLKDLISNYTKTKDPKCVYLGDNMIHDVYASAYFKCCSSIAISSELKSVPQLCYWGSYFGSEQEGSSYWNTVLKGYAVCCVSSLDVFIKRPLNFKYHCLNLETNDLSESTGYYVN